MKNLIQVAWLLLEPVVYGTLVIAFALMMIAAYEDSAWWPFFIALGYGAISVDRLLGCMQEELKQ